jgi:hypothetical protein
MPMTFTPRGKVSVVLLRRAVSWQVRRMIGARGRRFVGAAWVDGSADHCGGGGSEGPRMRPDSRASRAAMENRPDCCIARTWSLPSCFR